VAGGVPDNLGTVAVGEPVLPGGPAERTTRLPKEQILQGLQDLEISAGASDDPGRYVCNNLFYRILDAAGPGVVAGFIHLPHLYSIGAEEEQLLQKVVQTSVRQAVLARNP
jgi:pyroglutamyl-peptidase